MALEPKVEKATGASGAPNAEAEDRTSKGKGSRDRGGDPCPGGGVQGRGMEVSPAASAALVLEASGPGCTSAQLPPFLPANSCLSPLKTKTAGQQQAPLPWPYWFTLHSGDLWPQQTGHLPPASHVASVSLPAAGRHSRIRMPASGPGPGVCDFHHKHVAI